MLLRKEFSYSFEAMERNFILGEQLEITQDFIRRPHSNKHTAITLEPST